MSGLRRNIGSNFGRGWRVIGEASGLTKLTYVYQEFKGAGNKKTAKTLSIILKIKTLGQDIIINE